MKKSLRLDVVVSKGMLADIYVTPPSKMQELLPYLVANEEIFENGIRKVNKVPVCDYFDIELGHLKLSTGLIKYFVKTLIASEVIKASDITIMDQREDSFDYTKIDFSAYTHLYDYKTEKSVKLYDHQVKGLKTILKFEQGIIAHPTASGKGEIIVALSSILQHYGQTAVILPTSSSLISTAKRFDRYQIPYCRYHDVRHLDAVDKVILSTPKVLLNDINASNRQIVKSIKYLITNEAHHSQAATWRNLAVTLPNLLRCYGLSATPSVSMKDDIRKMSLREAMIRGSHGDIVSEIKSKEIKNLISIPTILNVKYVPPKINEHARFERDWLKLRHHLYRKPRLEFVASLVNLIDTQTKFTTVTFVSLIEKQGDILYELFPDTTVAWYGGGIVKNKLGFDLDKVSVFDAIIQGHVRHVIITSHGREDINLPNLNVAIMMELASVGTVKQCVGRVVRHGTPSFLVNINDTFPNVIKNQGWKRSTIIQTEYGAKYTNCESLHEFSELIKQFYMNYKSSDSITSQSLVPNYSSDVEDGEI